MAVVSSDELKASFDYERYQNGTIAITGYRGAAEDVVIPAYAVLGGKIHSVESIGTGAFYRRRSVRSVAIPNTIRTIGLSAFRGCVSHASVSIPASVESIDYLAFCECDSLTGFSVDKANGNYGTIDGILVCKEGTELMQYPPGREDASYEIPDRIQSVGMFAFDGCKRLKSITIPDSVRSIEGDAFSGCSSLRSFTVSGNNPSYRSADGVLFDLDMKVLVRYPIGREDAEYIIPKTVEKIESHAFHGCGNLRKVGIPDSVETVGASAFEGCTALESIAFPDSVRSLEQDSFRGCKKLKNIDFGNSEVIIEERAFEDCTALESVKITDSVRQIKDGAFGGCSSIMSFKVSEGNRFFRAVDGVLMDGSGERLIQYQAGKTDSAFTFYRGWIPKGSLYGCSHLESINVPENHAFYVSVDGVLFDRDIKTLVQYPAGKRDAEYVIPKSVERIEDHAFRGCGYLRKVGIPDSVKEIGWYAFADCTSLESVRIPDSVWSIDYMAFRNCVSLKDVVLPEELGYMMTDDRFEGCPVYLDRL